MSPIATPHSSPPPAFHPLSPARTRSPNGLDHAPNSHGNENGMGYDFDVRQGLGGTMDMITLLTTVDFAAKKHRNQRRKDFDETPYINHPVAVANCLATHGVTDVHTLQAALLHDTVEDTQTTIEELRDVFGDEVARIVEECTDPPFMSAPLRKALQTKTASRKSRQAQQVKLADKWHNLCSIRSSPPVGWTAERCQKYFIWAKTVTDACLPALPSMAAPLNELYQRSHFSLDGITHKCHPELGMDEVTQEEAAFLSEARKEQTLHAKSPRSSIYF